jgi:hypothetical protein
MLMIFLFGDDNDEPVENGEPANGTPVLNEELDIVFEPGDGGPIVIPEK